MVRRNRIDQLDTSEDADFRQSDAERGHAVATNVTLCTMPQASNAPLQSI
jgi:hypothetical protein